MRNRKVKFNLSSVLCKKVLSSSLASLSNELDECILILHEPEQPEILKKVDLKRLSMKLG